MKIVDQARLWFKEGKSDKVYEVDLVEVTTGQYVVNIRYGRRGTALRDGTKTPLPVALEQARSIFTAQVTEKTRKGYQRLTGKVAPTTVAHSRSIVDSAAQRAKSQQILLDALRRGHRSEIPVHLVVRKLGELGLKEAESELLSLLASGSAQVRVKPEVLRHWTIAALGRCGTTRSLKPLRALIDDAKAPRHLRDVAQIAITLIGGADERRKARALVPESLRAAPGSDPQAQLQAAEQLLSDNPQRAHTALINLYASVPLVLGDAATDPVAQADVAARRLVLGIARVARFAGEELGILRALNWAAELRRDGELFAVLTRRFETRGSTARETKYYFRRRAARTLRRLGAMGSPDYVAMAAELLLGYRDTDAERIVRSEHGTWDAFARYYALNFVLYGNSSRYEKAGHGRATWRCRAGYEPGDVVPAGREESFPKLWDKEPSALWRLGISEAAGIVVEFATRALRSQTQYLAQVTDADLASAMMRARLPMRQLAFDVARQRPPNLVLARGALASELDEADSWVLDWLERSPGLLGREAELLAWLITAKGKRIRDAAARLSRNLVIRGDLARSLVTNSISILIGFTNAPGEEARAESASAFLLEHAAEALSALGEAVLGDLLAHPMPSVALLGAELVRQRAKTRGLGDGLLNTLLRSPHAKVRVVGASIVSGIAPEVMKEELELLVSLVLTDQAELRDGTRGLIARVAARYPDVGRALGTRLIDSLLKRLPEGVPAHVVSLLKTELRACLPRRSSAEILALIGALSPHAREAGGLLMVQLGPDDLELDTIVRLANHEILAVRQGSWAIAAAAKERFGLAPVSLARLCDAKWDDSRNFAFEFVRGFPPERLVPTTVIAICDSIEPHVQRFGQSLLLEYWQDAYAELYLLRLSEHPSTNIQLLVSGLLERYAHGNPRLLEQLIPCLTTILSQVNRGGVAKLRVLEFLRQEAVASPEAARLIGPLLERQSLTLAVSQKGSLIASMVNLHERFPEVKLPIRVKPLPQHDRRRRGV